MSSITLTTGDHYLMRNKLIEGSQEEFSASLFEHIIFISRFEIRIWPRTSFSKGLSKEFIWYHYSPVLIANPRFLNARLYIICTTYPWLYSNSSKQHLKNHEYQTDHNSCNGSINPYWNSICRPPNFCRPFPHWLCLCIRSAGVSLL